MATEPTKPTSAKTTKASPVQAVSDVIAAQKSRRNKASTAADPSAAQVMATVVSKEIPNKTPGKRRNLSTIAQSADAAVDMAVQMVASNAVAKGAAKASKKALEQELGDLVTNAQSSMRNAKDSAIQAAVYCFRFWLRTQSADAGKWYKDAVEARNKLIKSDNGEIDERMRKADQYKNNKLPASDLANEVAYDEVHAKQIAAHKAKYEADVGRSPAEWKSMRKLLVEAKPGANPFTEIVKFVFCFEKPSEASLISRYATVLSVLHVQFKGKADLTHEVAVDYLVKLGGFEAAIAAYAKPQLDQKPRLSEEVKKKLGAQLVADAAEAAANTVDATQIALQPAHAHKGFVLLLAHSDGSKVTVVGEAEADGKDVQKFVERHQVSAADIANPGINFLNRVFNLGELVGGTVAKGNASYEKGNKAVVRKLSMRPDEKGVTQLVVSAKGTDVAPVIHATPHASILALRPISGCFSLLQEAHLAVKNTLNDPLLRYFSSLDVTPLSHPEGNPQWLLDNDEVPEHQHQMTWANVTNSQKKALDVEPDFATKVTATLIIRMEHLKSLYTEGAAKWGSAPTPNKTVKCMTLSFEGGNLSLAIEGFSTVTVSVSSLIAAPFAVSLRPQDMYALLKVLVAQNTDSFLLQIDPTGLLAVRFRDNLGYFAIFQPLLRTDDGRLNNKRIGHLAVNGLSTEKHFDVVGHIRNANKKVTGRKNAVATS